MNLGLRGPMLVHRVVPSTGENSPRDDTILLRANV
jgi:hypothetical protein